MKKNIAILIPQLAGGGAERVASNLSLYLPESKYNKHVIVYNSGKDDYPYEGKLINISSRSARNPIGKLVIFFERVYKLKKIKKQYNIDTTISFLPGPNLVNILSKRKTGKEIVSVRNFVSKSSDGFYGGLSKILMKLFYNKADTVVAVSKVIKQDLINNFDTNENKVKVIYNPYDIDNISKLANEKIEEEYSEIFKNPTIVTVGSLTDQKGQWHLIKAFTKVRKRIPDAKLLIIGRGELEKYLKSLTKDLKLEKDVIFLGFQTNPFKYLARSTVYVFPSLYEGFPNALCEAMACGLPVISTDCKSGPREILAPTTDINLEANNTEFQEYGILVPICDGIKYKYMDEATKQEENLSESIISILKNQKELTRYSLQAINRVKQFSVENIISSWESEL